MVLDLIQAALVRGQTEREATARENARARLAGLTEREQEVLLLPGLGGA